MKLHKKIPWALLCSKKPLFSPIWGHFSVHKSEKSKFLAWIHMEYFHLGIFVIPRVCLIRKYGSLNTAYFSVDLCFSGCRAYTLKKFRSISILPFDFIEQMSSLRVVWKLLQPNRPIFRDTVSLLNMFGNHQIVTFEEKVLDFENLPNNSEDQIRIFKVSLSRNW